MAKELSKSSPEEDREVEVRLEMGEMDAPATFSNFMGVQYHEGIYVLTFGQLIPPLVFGTPAMRKEHFAAMESLSIRPVARIVLTPDKARDVVEALRQNIQRNTPGEGGEIESTDNDSEE